MYPIPWHFRNIRDLRTAMDLFNIPTEINPNAHDALADCYSQIISAQKILKLERKMKDKQNDPPI